ncbi:MAG: trehalose-6-phosphate synthase [Candidatus Omnitrophica bacterium]|nr:trehalose-6-phosphate synthase [Candidatus Omnitrophota bacterium]MDD5236167.1 trehalose-6-phosphate synthase [Candidatus Omnitrophota bacterium]MDD5610937.1 trehalose-6-phosphate synthase [Candidatus Omnitrophota bacterium]
MKRLLIFILPILIIVAIGFTVFGIMQVRFTEEKLMEDLQRKAKSVAEGIDFSAKAILINNDLKSANRLVESFQKRERLQGCIIYDKEGKILAITERFSDWKEKDKPYLKDILATKVARGALENFKDYSVYSYIIPVIDDENNILGMVEVIYDTSYVFTTMTDLWRRLSISLISLLVLIVLIMLLIQRQIFTLPVVRLTEWFQHFQRGEIEEVHPIKGQDELGKLASEVEQVALSLRVARKVVSEKATERMQKDELWTEAKLRDLIHARLGENALFVVSNREPYLHIIDDITGAPKCVRPASGVVTAIDPVMCACGGTWIAHGSGNADRKFVNSKDKLGVPPGDNRYILKRVWLSKEEEEGYYYGFSNEGLWPLCHMTHTRPVFRETDWQMYTKVNQKFADSVLAELPSKNPFVFIQDYHFTLLAKMIKEKRPDTTIALFWHIPWPNPEVFSTCPYQEQILEGMLACDLIGFHVQSHCNNFLETANRLLESRVDTEKFSIVRFGKETFVRAFPISVNGHFKQAASSPDLLKEIERIKKEYELEGKIVAIGVDRIDYTKGLVERILAVDRFIEKNPQYKNKFVFIQLAAPSRTHIKHYHDLMNEIDELVEKKNWKYSEGEWRPIIYLKRHFSQEEIKPYYALADICIVSSLHDGMNLVAKEYVASKADLKGALILSRFTGAARELTDSVLINPYSIEEFADAIKLAVEMPPEESRKRMENMRKIISENNIYRWAGNIITELTALRKA